MQYMEFFAVRHDTGAALPYATVQAFPSGGTTPVEVYGEAGAPLGLQASADGYGRVGLALPFGAYDLQIAAGGYAAPRLNGVRFGETTAVGLFSDIAGLFVPPGVSVIQTTGYSRLGVGVARYAVTTSTGSTAWRVQSADGRWWALAEPWPDVSMFGAIGDGVADDTPALTAAIAYASPATTGSAAQGGGVVRIRAGMVVRITAQVYLDPFVVIEGDLPQGGFFEDFTPGQASGSGILVDFDFGAGGAIEAVGFVAATGARIAPSTYVKGADVDAGTYSHLTGCGLRNLFVYTARATAFCPIRFVGAPQWVLDNVAVQGFWHGPIANASWAGSVPRLFSRCLYSGLILDQDCNGCSLGHLYLSGDLAGPTVTSVPAGRAYPNWDPYGLSPADPNVQPAGANQLRTGLVVMSGDPASAQTVICEGWNIALVVHASGLSCGVLEAEAISGWLATCYASRLVADNLFAYLPGQNLIYACVGADVRLGVPGWTAGFFASPVQFYSAYANAFTFEGSRRAAYPYLGARVTYRQAEDAPTNDLYCDSAAGDDTRIGCDASAPLTNITQALTRLRTDKPNRIFLMQGQTHSLLSASVLETLLVDGCRLELHGYAPASGPAARPVLVAPPDAGNVHTNGLILRNATLLFQDVDYQVRMCTGTAEGYNAGLYIRGVCDVRFAGGSTVQIESGAALQLGLFQPWYGSAGLLTWDLEDAAQIGEFPGSTAAAALGVSAYEGQGRLTVAGAANSSASPPIDPAIHANGYVGPSYPSGAVNQS